MGTCCPGRPGTPGLDGNLDGTAPGRAAAVGRGGAGGFTRAPGGKGFQFGLGAEAVLVAEVGCVCRAAGVGEAAAGRALAGTGGAAGGFATAGAAGAVGF